MEEIILSNENHHRLSKFDTVGTLQLYHLYDNKYHIIYITGANFLVRKNLTRPHTPA